MPSPAKPQGPKPMPPTVATPRKLATRAKILRTAARAIRARGPAGVGVQEVMREAGLTHGGFYAHFASKDDLVAQAIHSMFADGHSRFLARTEGLEGLPALRHWLGAYLSPGHRDDAAGGCPLAALTSDVARLDAPARAAFDDGLRAVAGRLQAMLPAQPGVDGNAVALAMLTRMAGAVALARAVSDPALSDGILGATRTALLAELDALTGAA